jgi:hypothetical protein
MNPTRVNFEQGWTAIDLLRHITEQQIASMPYESLGFREIIKHCTDWQDWSTFSSKLPALEKLHFYLLCAVTGAQE